MKLLFIISLLCTGLIRAQTLNGIVYDAESTIDGAKVLNTRTNKFTVSNKEGDFNIDAIPNDTIILSSYFHKTQQFVVQPKHLERKVVIELQKTVNQLDKVEVVKVKEKEFKVEGNTQNNKNQLSEDIKRNPHMYGTSSEYGVDFVRLGKLVANIFKKKNAIPPSRPIEYSELVELFNNNGVFSESLLFDDFDILPKHMMLFLEYCETKQLDSKLLNKDQTLVLMDSLYRASKEFIILLNTPLKKD